MGMLRAMGSVVKVYGREESYLWTDTVSFYVVIATVRSDEAYPIRIV